MKLIFTHPQAIPDVDEFFHWNLLGEILHYITCSPMDPLQWMGAVRMRAQTADKNIIVINTTTIPQSCEVKAVCLLETNPSLRLLSSNRPSWIKYESIIHNNASSVHPLLSSHIKSHIFVKNCLHLWPVFDLCRFLSWFRQDDFFTGESNIMNRILGRSKKCTAEDPLESN